jgi:hypothetical protein
MKIYHLSIINIDKFVNHYRKSKPSLGAVVVAENEKDARRTAAEANGRAFLNSKFVKCEEVNPEEYVCRCLIMSDDNLDIYEE